MRNVTYPLVEARLTGDGDIGKELGRNCEESVKWKKGGWFGNGCW